MTTMIPQPTINLYPLHTADGSCYYISPRNTHVLISGINYPIEVPYRSDEIPQSTYIEVSLRPHNGVAMVKERHIETLIKRTLSVVVLGEETPRTGLQVTVQVMESQVDETLPGGIKADGQGNEWLDLLVGGINAAVLGCLDGGVRMKGLVGAVLIGVTRLGEIIVSPDIKQRKSCRSLHVFGFESGSKCILMDSQGTFDIEDLQKTEETARTAVCGDSADKAMNGDVNMTADNLGGACLFDEMRRAVEARLVRSQQARE